MTTCGPSVLRQMRLLTADLDEANQYLSDQDYAAFLTLNSGDVRLAAADALDAIATSESLISKVVRTQDLATDGPKVAADLRARANQLRTQAATAAAKAGADTFFASVPVDVLSDGVSSSMFTVWGL